VREDSDNLTSLNSKLFDRSIYDSLMRKQVDVWTAIRNKADHGKFEDLSSHDAKHTLEGVRQFLSLQLAKI
jgi:hypothetical protein